MFTRTYELTDKQQVKVRAEIQQMEKERRESLGPAAEQLDRAQEQMQQYWRKRMAGGDNDGRRAWREAMDDEEFAKLREKLQSLREQTSFDWQEHNERIEKLLPAEQVEAGRKRREEWMTRWTERRGSGERGSRWGGGDSRGGWGERWSDRRRALKARIARDKASAPSLATIWPTAAWAEREIFDFYGIEFSGHPDLRRMFLPEDWEGYPLRKDYPMPARYHDVPLEGLPLAVRENQQNQEEGA